MNDLTMNFAAAVMEAIYDIGPMPIPVIGPLAMVSGLSVNETARTMSFLQTAGLIETVLASGVLADPDLADNVRLTDKGRDKITECRALDEQDELGGIGNRNPDFN